MKFKKIFEPGQIGNMQVANRLIVPPMLTEYAAEDGSLTDRYIDYYEEKAKGGWGLIICEDNSVDPYGAGFKNIAGLWDDGFIPMHKELTEKVHKYGAKIAVQVYHAGRESDSSVKGKRPVAPSAIADPTKLETPKELTLDEIEVLIEEFAQAIRRAKEAGYDGVELHGAHGYLINQFVSPFSNKRTDAYGGNMNNRLKFPLEIISRAKELVGEEFPIIYRISADEMVEGGLTIEDTKVIAQILEENGIAAIHVSAGVYKSGDIISAPAAVATAPFSDYAAQIKKLVNISVFAVNKIIYPETAESLLREEKADFISMGRASLADPQMPKKIREGREEEILPCIGCWQGCQGELAAQKSMACLVNPKTGREKSHSIRKAEKKKKVMVIGGGPAGMEAAIVAAARGHEVVLYEKSDRLGGKWLLSAIPPGKENFNAFTVWQKGEMERKNVKIVLNCEVTEETVALESPNDIIYAAGSEQKIPDIPGVCSENVFTAEDILLGKTDFSGRAVVIGGGTVGAETAEHLAVHGCSVTIVKRSGIVAGDMAGAPRHFLMQSFDKYGVRMFENTKTLKIMRDGIMIEDSEGERAIPADFIVIATGYSSKNQLAKTLSKKYPLKIVGDAQVSGKALEAVKNAYEAAMEI